MMGLLHRIRSFFERSGNRPPEWTQTLDRPWLKVWRRGDEVVEAVKVNAVESARARYYDSAKTDPTSIVITNGPASIDDAVWAAEMFMEHGVLLPACPHRVEREDGGMKFTRVPIRRVRDYVEYSDESEPDAIWDFVQKAQRGELPTTGGWEAGVCDE